MKNELIGLIGDDAAFISNEADIYYYSGFASADAELYISKDKRFILTDNRYFLQAKEQAPEFEIFDIAKGYKSFFELVGEDRIYIQEPYLSVLRFEKLKASTTAELVNGNDLIQKPRQVKTPLEIQKLKAAEALGDDAFAHVLPMIKAGVSEKAIADTLEFYIRKQGASGLSFNTIVASGTRGALPHGEASDKVIETGELVTLDFGCVLDHYCSDMTRTVAVGKPSEQLCEIYSIVLKAQKNALDGAHAGMTGKEIDALARDIIKDAGYGDCFGHTLGHSVGLEIHERPVFSPKNESKIVKGNVITFEPGIYIENIGGVRIEDVGVISETGVENITSSPKELFFI